MTIKALYPTSRPTLDLNFASAKRLDPRVTFTRTSTATFVGTNGLIQSAASGAARFDHNPTTGESLGLLVEEARTNLVTYSNFASDWTLADATVILNSGVAPDGTLTANLLTGNSNVSSHFIGKNVSMGASSHTFSCFIKTGSIATASLFLTQSGNNGAAYDLSAGTIVNVQGTGNTASIQSAGNGWWKCSITNTGSSDIFDGIRICIDDTAFTSKSATGSIYIWGAQLEAGSFPTSYIPTSGATVTRAADVASMTGTNFSSWYNQSQGTMFAQARLNFSLSASDVFPSIYQIGDYPNRLWALYLNNVVNILTIGADVHSRNLQTLTSSPQLFKVAQALSNTSLTYSASKDGATSLTGSLSSAVTNTTSLYIGGPNVGATKHIARLAYYPVRLTDTQLQALTAS